MARARPASNPDPRQLTLDEWSGALGGRPQNGTASERRKTKRALGTGVASGRSQTPALALLTTREAADLLRVHPRTVQRLVRRGDLAAVRLGTATRFDPDDVACLIAQLKRTGAGAEA